MIGLIQRVSRASVHVDGNEVGAIACGLLALIGVQRGDAARNAERLAERILSYRVFSDAQGRMNRSLAEVDGGLLVVPQFTLAAETTQGTRPGFQGAAQPELAMTLFALLLATLRQRHAPIAAGIFGAHMQVSLVNDGPVTFWLQA